MTRKNVLFVVPTLRRAGAECQVVSLANNLSSEQFKKFLFYYAPGSNLREELDPQQVEVFEKQKENKLDLAVGREIGRIIDEYEIDIVHCTLLNALVFASMGLHFSRRRPLLVSVIHTTKNANFKLDLVDFMVHRALLKRSDEIWFVSEIQADVWLRKMPFVKGKHRVIHNGIDTSFFDPAAFNIKGQELRRSLGIEPADKVICSVAAFRPEKLHEVLIDAVSQIDIDKGKVWLLLAGAGPMENKIREKVRSSGLESKVRFLGSLADVRPLLAASNCKVLVSEAETFSMAMLEAMAMQVPVITTSVGGAPEAIQDNVSGILVEPNNSSQLALKIRELLLDDSMQRDMGKRAREIVVQRFSLHSMLANTECSLLDLAANV